MDVDEAIALCGEKSRWHIIMFLVLGITCLFPATWQMLAIIFIGGMPRDFHCKVAQDRINDTIPFYTDKRTGEWKHSQCRQYVNESSDGVRSFSINETIPCTDGYTYHSDFTSTIVMEWELVCAREYLKDLSQTVFSLGVMVGAMAFTLAADKWGRKPVFLALQWILLVVGTVTSFVHNYYLFLFMRFVTGALQQGITLSGYVLMCEIFPASRRTFAGTMCQVIWGVAMLIQAGIAYALRDWRDFQLAITLPLVVTLGCWWVLPESMSWQAANQKEKQAEEQLRKIAKCNRIDDYPEHPLTEGTIDLQLQRQLINAHEAEREETPEDVDQKKSEEKEKSVEKPAVPKENLVTVFKHRKCRMNILVMCALWFVNSLVYYGLSLSSGDLAGDRYVNYAIGGLVEGLAFFSLYFVLERFGRRIPLCVYHCIAGVCLVISSFLPLKSNGIDLTPAVITFNMLGRFCISSSYAAIFLYTGELFPVNVRSTCTGVCSVAARIAGMLAPFSSLLVKKVYWLPGCVFAVMSFIVGGLVLLLPETQGRALPQSIAEMTAWDRKRGRAKSFDVHASMRESRRERRRSTRGGDVDGEPALA